MAAASYCRFVTEPSKPTDCSPLWPKGADFRIVGISCPECGRESREAQHRNAASFLRNVTCSSCGWSGRVPL